MLWVCQDGKRYFYREGMRLMLRWMERMLFSLYDMFCFSVICEGLCVGGKRSFLSLFYTAAAPFVARGISSAAFLLLSSTAIAFRPRPRSQRQHPISSNIDPSISPPRSLHTFICTRFQPNTTSKMEGLMSRQEGTSILAASSTFSWNTR